MFEQFYKQVISGEATSVSARLMRCVLMVLSWPYRWAMAIRNWLYDAGWKDVHRVSVPVVSVGNLTTGGTGKTPVVAFIVKQLQQNGHRPGIVSRGYRADESGQNDEKRVLNLKCPGVPHVQMPDRVAAAQRLIRDNGVSVIVLDDGYQHRRIHRDLNVCLIDATCPFGFGHVLPRGLLRESIAGLSRADLVLITRADRLSPEQCRLLSDQLAAHTRHNIPEPLSVSFRVTDLMSANQKALNAASVHGKPVVVVTGIGNPEAFVATCGSLGAIVRATRFYPDHHHFSADDLRQIRVLACQHDACVLTTVKDLVKLPATGETHPAEDDFSVDIPAVDILAVDIEAQLDAGAADQLRTSLPRLSKSSE